MEVDKSAYNFRILKGKWKAKTPISKTKELWKQKI